MGDLRRYTELPYLLHMLSQKQITLLNPTSWVDRNDAYFLKRYLERRKLQSILVMCLSKSAATYHHWHVFAPNASGVRIEFHEQLFSEWAANIPGGRLEPVKYVRLEEELLAKITLDQLPFVKRHAFRHEGEVRLIVENFDEKLAFLAVAFDFAMIKEVILSPWLARPAIASIKKAIRAAAPGSTFLIKSTTMLDSRLFKEVADNAV